jgi:hypothetical protein
MDSSAFACATPASATCSATSAESRSLSVIPPVFSRLSARSFSATAWALLASAVARAAFARSWERT